MPGTPKSYIEFKWKSLLWFQLVHRNDLPYILDPHREGGSDTGTDNCVVKIT